MGALDNDHFTYFILTYFLGSNFEAITNAITIDT